MWLLLFWSPWSKVERVQESWFQLWGISEVEVSYKTPCSLDTGTHELVRLAEMTKSGWTLIHHLTFREDCSMTALSSSAMNGHHSSGRTTAPNFRARDGAAPSPQGCVHISQDLSQTSFPGRLLPSPSCELLLEFPSAWLSKICSIFLKKL